MARTLHEYRAELDRLNRIAIRETIRDIILRAEDRNAGAGLTRREYAELLASNIMDALPSER